MEVGDQAKVEALKGRRVCDVLQDEVGMRWGNMWVKSGQVQVEVDVGGWTRHRPVTRR